VEVSYPAAFRRKSVAKPSENPKQPVAGEPRAERAARLPAAEPPSPVTVPRAQSSTIPTPPAAQKAAQPVRQQPERDVLTVSPPPVAPVREAREPAEAPAATRQIISERQGGAEPTKSARRRPEEEPVERPASEQPKPGLLRELFTPRQTAAPADVPQRNEEANPAVTLQRPESNQ
jgi:hypothetical protein